MRFLIDMALSPQLGAWLTAQGRSACKPARALASSRCRNPGYGYRSTSGRGHRRSGFPKAPSNTRRARPRAFLLRGGNYNEAQVLECVRRALAVIPADELEKSIVVVDREKVRRRWLPV